MNVNEYFNQHKRILGIAGIAAVVVFAVSLVAGALLVEAYFTNRVYPHVRFAHLDIGGLTRAEAATFLETWQDEWWKEELKYAARDEMNKELTTVKFFPILVAEGSGQSHEIVWYDIESMLDKAFAVGRSSDGVSHSRPRKILALLQAAVSEQALEPVVVMDEDQLQAVLRLKLADYETSPRDASLVWRSAYQRPSIVTEEAGNTFDYVAATNETKAMLLEMRSRTIAVHRAHREPKITTEEANNALAGLAELQQRFPVTMTYRDELFNVDRTYELSWPSVYASLQVLKPEERSEAVLALAPDALSSFFAGIENQVNVEPQNAKFEIAEDNKVKQFEPSRTGYTLNREHSIQAINSLMTADQPTRSVALVVEMLTPDITTDDINDLGIKEVLGTGYSNFRGSPANRIHNIRVGVNRLNGMLISPGEEFSLLKALRPFTLSAGYLPELVIKGDKIEPEIGGGLCQIGSTTFRAAMNSGLEITERRNHSLVVSYYNDPRNFNPGTDATIYDPAPDFKFLNDTGNYVLIVTSMNVATGDLNFTFWGTSDGRKAAYTEPVVSRWIPAGEDRLIESPDLQPGEKKCQAAHVGAVASFVYTIEREGQEPKETTFTSNYRPLPRICLVGVAPEVPVDQLPAEGDPTAVTTNGDPIAF
jgi:vancomycin resistance protein YoaR